MCAAALGSGSVVAHRLEKPVLGTAALLMAGRPGAVSKNVLCSPVHSSCKLARTQMFMHSSMDGSALVFTHW